MKKPDRLVAANNNSISQQEVKEEITSIQNLVIKEFICYAEENKKLKEELTAAKKERELEEKRTGELAIAYKIMQDYKYAFDIAAILAITDQNGIINYVNDNFCKITKYKHEELIGQDHRMMSSGYHSKTFMEDLWFTIGNGKIWKGDFKNKAKDGTFFWVDTCIVPLPGEDGKPYQYLAIRYDITESKKIKEVLRESETLNKGIISSLSSHITVIDESGTIITTNRAWDDFAKANGIVSPESVSAGINYFDVCEKSILGGDLTARLVLKGIQSVFSKEKETFELEYPCHSPIEGRWFTLRVSNFGNDGSKVLISHQNITERKKAEQKLAQSESRLNEAQAIANIGSWETDLQTLNVIWSEETYRIFEIIPGSMVPTHEGFLKLTHPDDRAKVDKAFKNSTESDTFYSIEHRVNTANGREKIVEERWRIFKTDDGLPVRAIGTCQDITDRRIADKKLLESEQKFRALANELETERTRLVEAQAMAKVGSWETDLQSLKIDWSLECHRIFETDPQNFEVTYATFREFVHPEDRAKSDEAFSNSLRDGFATIEHRIITAKGHKKFVLENWKVILDEKGFPVRAVGTCQDITEPKKAEEDDRFKANLLNTIGQAAVGTDIKDAVNYWNKAAEIIYGWSKEEALGKNITDLIPSLQTKEQAIQIKENLKNGNSWSGEFSIQRKDGSNFPALTTKSPVYDQNNKISGIISISSDITEKKNLENLLDKANRLARIGNWEIDVIKGTVYWSQITKEIREADPDFVPDLSLGIQFFKKGKSRDTISYRVKKCIEKGIPWDEELQIVTQKGNLKWIRTIGEGEFVNGKCIRVYGSFQDIDARKKAETEVLKAYQEKNTILESIGDAFFAVDDNWVVTYWNNHAETMLLMPKNKIVGKHLWEIFSESVNSASYKNYHQAIETKQVICFKDYYESLNKWFEINAYPSDNGLSVFFKDITRQIKFEDERTKLTADIVRRNNDLEQFSYIISHNLRAPVANIMGLSQQLNDDIYSNETKKKFLQGLMYSVKLLDNVILDLNSVLAVRREVSQKTETVNLSELIANIESSIQNLIQNEQVQINTNFSEVSVVTSIRSYLYSIFYNLITNSIKYRQHGLPALIEIKTEKNGDKIIITFKDNGSGIDLGKSGDQIFGLYKRFHKNTEGKGMGLFMVKTQVEMLGGTIAVQSEINVGTEYRIEFQS